MVYRRYKSDIALSKAEKVGLMADYVEYCERLFNEEGPSALNVKIPRDVFDEVLDQIGTLLNEQALEQAKRGAVKDFLDANPLPSPLRELLPDDFRAFALMLNALKQWVVAESAATDRYLLGGTARQTCRAAVTRCIVAGGELGDDAELHHPLRDGRPPLLLSKEGHVLVERYHQNAAASAEGGDDPIWPRVCEMKKDRHMSWVQLREGCDAVLAGSSTQRPGAKSFANLVIRETGLSADEVISELNARALGL